MLINLNLSFLRSFECARRQPQIPTVRGPLRVGNTLVPPVTVVRETTCYIHGPRC